MSFPRVPKLTRVHPLHRWFAATLLALLPLQGMAAGTIPQMWKRTYGEGSFKVVKTLEQNQKFTRYLLEYPSEGLRLQGFVNVPKQGKSHPVVVMLHGYVEPSSYKTLAYTTRYADDLARAGVIVFHPNYRGHGGSEGKASQDPFRNDYTLDVLNLLELVRKQTGTGILKTARDNIGLWGHSMGGGIALKVLTVDPRIEAAVLYAPMSGDEQKNLSALENWMGQSGRLLNNLSKGTVRQNSALQYLDQVDAAIRVHHAVSDPVVPYSWTQELCEAGKKLNLSMGCTRYASSDHTLRGSNDEQFRKATRQFFLQYL